MSNILDEFIALIPVRSGSKRVPNKNLSIVGGLSLLERKIKQLQNVGIKKIYVGSDSKDYLQVALNSGAIPIARANSACDESIASANQMICDFSLRVEGKYAIWCHCTNPFIYSQIYSDAIDTFIDKCIVQKNYDSLISVYKIQNHMWNHEFRPVNYDPKLSTHTLAKNLDPVYFQDGGIFIQELRKMQINSYFFGTSPYLFEIDYLNGFDINTQEDLRAAQILSEALDKEFSFSLK
jgi:CMP-N-acetylneuraminic acid synthetase